MEQRTLGRTGLHVSAVGFGCGAIGGLLVKGEPAVQRRSVERAIDAGFRYFDTAPSYGDGRSEENLGRVLGELGARAADLVVGTKFRVEPGLADDAAGIPRAIRESAEASLRRLRRERVHLLQLHTRIVADRTGSAQSDAGGLTAAQVLGPVVDGLRAVREAGLADYAGITATGETEATRRVIDSGLIDTAQVFFNALNPSAGWAGRVAPGPAGGHDFGGIVDTAAQRGVGVIVIRPLAAGALALTARGARHPNAGGPGGVTGEVYENDLDRAQRLASLAAALGLEGTTELALRFALAKPGVSTVLVGFSDESQVADAIRWSARGPLPPDAVEQVLTLASG
jgi:L-galactose dehydrogenase/L-glyceraldehyde 3-phosphate reductase